MFQRLIGDREIVIFDLEWNQGTYYTNPRIPHEIIEIGACRIDAEGRILSRFSRTVKPKVYRQIDKHIQKVTGITQEELNKSKTFTDPFTGFIDWIGDARLVTWGRDDFPVLKRNAEYYRFPVDVEPPIDAQLLFGFLFYHDESRQFNLHSALEEMKIENEIPAHRAIYDAEATSLLIPLIDEQLDQLEEEQFVALTAILEKERRIANAKITTLPTNCKTYAEAICDSRVTHIRCPVCSGHTTFAVPWFDAGKERYESICRCHRHGYIFGSMHFKKNTSGKVIIHQRLAQATEEQVKSVKNKYHAFKQIPEGKRHHRLEMPIQQN